ncbi:MAG TPA: universal stress protein [Candidatus Sulfotelmatobacter sp.]|nr:universal stress protein [Candidatus Sulfotelmatobacter sp.]
MAPAPPRILASINDPEQIVDVMCLACNLAGEDRHAEVHALHVVLIPRALPLDADVKAELALGESLLAKAEEVAEERFGRRVHTDLLQARAVGPAILEEIREKGIDAVVLGYRRRRGFARGFLGTTVDYVVKHATCRVVINVPPERAAGGRPGGTA